ncbi:helix-turn-helix domain-containing protein [Streptomyces flavofungini]|uniref:Helix-turn-helix domain-containing protein n=1 Tax=Streptomyces flavofungini TaxID=68200 RepID=A0ABS0XG72_9ACTN|nr:helix-turn-helix transcriptional regulator [Streptomyces flavofungini]MBJ3812214.1 helix-turn-helix domain-containing protein [Streptomyces flavofungini]GHC71383.1 transcriptional regulator [Streptomyces flavofungini]
MGSGDLAALLRELKDRSGLSYGVLAKRLHVSTSTLHRYVNGTAVPTEFAPVERLGRLCRASPDELVELHRRWIVADVSRGRKAEGAAGAAGAVEVDGVTGAAGAVGASGAAEAAGADEATEPAEPVASAEPVEPVEATVPVEATTPTEAVPAFQPDPDPDPDPHPEADPAPAPRPESELPSVSSTPAPATTATGARRSGRLSRPRRRQLAVVGAVGVVLALGGTALALQNASGESGDGRDKKADRAVPSADLDPSGTGRNRDENPSATPSAKEDQDDKDEKGKKGEAKGKGEESEGKGGQGKGGTSSGGGQSGTGSSGAAKGTPVTARVRPFPYYPNPCSQHFLIDREPGDMLQPPSEREAPTWVRAMGGVQAAGGFVEVTLQGTGEDTVVLERVDVDVRRKSAPLKWNSYQSGNGCGGPVGIKSFNVDLDTAQPTAVPKSGQRKFPYKVSESDPEVFYFEINTENYDVQWSLNLQWSSGGRSGVLRIDDAGRPFRTSADEGRPEYKWPNGATKWSREEPQSPDQG